MKQPPLWSNPNFRLLWLALVVSGLGDVLFTVGVIVTVFEQTGSALQTAGVMVATTLPAFLFSPTAGAIVDRYPRQQVMVLIDLFRAGLVGLLWLLSRAGPLDIWLLYVVVAGLAAANAFYLPARQALIPAIAPRDQLVQANSIVLGTNQGTMAVGFTFGGFLILWLSLDNLIAIDLLTFIASAAIVPFIRPSFDPPSGSPVRRPPFRQSVREGLDYLRRHPVARPLVVMEALEHIPHGVWTAALMLVFVERALQGSPDDWGAQNGAYWFGTFVGAVIATAARHWIGRRPGWIIIANAGLLGLFTLIYAASPNNLFALIMAFVFGPPMAIRDVAQDTLLQASVAPDMLGRIYALRHMAWNLTFMSSALVLSFLADFLPVRLIYAAAGVLYLASALFALFRPALRRSTLTPQQAKP